MFQDPASITIIKILLTFMEDFLYARTITEYMYYIINPKTMSGPSISPSNA